MVSLSGYFRSYYYVSPKWSQVYLDELSFLGNLRFEKDLARLLFTGSYSEEAVSEANYTSDSYYGDRDDDGSSRVSLDSFVGMSDEKCPQENFINSRYFDQFIYKPLTMENRKIISEAVLKNEVNRELKLPKALRSELDRNQQFWENVKTGFISKERKRKELDYNLKAKKLWEYVPKRKWINIDTLVEDTGFDKKEIIHIIKQWAIAGLIKASLGKEHHRISYKIFKKSEKLYNFVYSREKSEIKHHQSAFNEIATMRK